MGELTGHYDERYFGWQKQTGQTQAWANAPRFQEHIDPGDCVIDFGCGGGYLLSELTAEKRIGIEINDTARSHAQTLGLEVHADASGIPDQCADVIISSHVLEHTLHPLEELRALYPKLKLGGKIVFVVPCESIARKFKHDDINQHLYTWSPLNLGNLFTHAGFEVEECRPYMHRWTSASPFVAKYGGRWLCDLLARVTAHLRVSWFQVQVVARKPVRECGQSDQSRSAAA